VNRRKIINDPVHGFITIPGGVPLRIVEHPWFQRLGRIKQLGLTHYVYPGAMHTRFAHALGAMHLMQQAIHQLRQKGHHISTEEAEGATLAILLHDIGHGPFSHALENSIANCHHENISEAFMTALNFEMKGRLSLAISIFNNTYHKLFLHQLVSGQLDVDRLDYLKRDSFYTGVSEGVIGAERILKMIEIRDNQLVVESKAIYSIENFITARRLMYWQVYLHKTSLAAEYMLMRILRRAKFLRTEDKTLFCTPSLTVFMENNITIDHFINDPSILNSFANLDDVDIFCAVKIWQNHSDPVLSNLCKCLVNRRLFRIEMKNNSFGKSYVENIKSRVKKKYRLSTDEMQYFVIEEQIQSNAYDTTQNTIKILNKDESVIEIAQATDQMNFEALVRPVSKFLLIYPKDV